MWYTDFEVILVTIGERIREIRKSLNLTQKQLGELSGIAEPTIRRYELGKLNPKRETIAKIAKALDVHPVELSGDLFKEALLEALKGSKVYILREKLNNGGQMNREEKDWLTRNVNSNTYFKSAVPLQGWRFDFSDVLRTFIVCQYGHWTEYKATDKTGLRRYLYGRIDNIVELEK